MLSLRLRAPLTSARHIQKPLRDSKRESLSSKAGSETKLKWEALSKASLEEVLEIWQRETGSAISVEAMQTSDLKPTSKCISEAFFTPSPVSFMNGFFAFQFEAQVLDGIYSSLRYRSKSDFGMLIVWDALRQSVIGAVQISRQEEAQVLQSLPSSSSSYAYISSMSVLPKMRRRGIGRALLSAAEYVAWTWGEDEILLHVHKDNPSALDLYLNNGYSELPTTSLLPPYVKGRQILLLRRQW